MAMNLIRLLHQYKFVIFLLFSIYIFSWLSISTYKQLSDTSKSHPSNRLKYRSISTFYFIINHLLPLNINLTLIDPDILTDLFIRQVSFDKLERQFITFAITNEFVHVLSKALHDTDFSVKTSLTKLSNGKTLTDHIFIEFENKTIHIAVLHKYNSYYRIHKNHLALSDDIYLSYGDILRAVEHIEIQLHEYLFYYPRNVTHFLWLYKTSQFIHCNRTLADRMKETFHVSQSSSQLRMILHPMRNIANGLERLEKHYWLAGGVLLGWYRHCGLIPFTEDVDFGLFAEEYEESIRNYFLGNPVTHIWAALGLVNDSLEFRLSSGKYIFDLFWAYPDGNQRWYGYQVRRFKYRRTMSLLSTLCSCDFFGYRFSIPCSPVEYFDNEYGKDKWQIPLAKNYTWINMKYHSMWDDISWMYAVRLYTPEGKLRSDELAISWVAKRFNYTYTSVPSFLNVIPNETVTLPPLKKKLIYTHQ